MEFIQDKDGERFELHDTTIRHIQQEHRILNPVGFVREVLQTPDAIVESNWDAGTYLYYKKQRRGYKVVVANFTQKLIKTAYLERQLKEGKILWLNPKVMR